MGKSLFVMKTMTITMDNEREAVALAGFFNDCGITSSSKGKDVKATGDPEVLSYLYGKFVTIALL